MGARIDVAVVGAGVLGLAVARDLALRGRRVAVVEKEAGLAQHQTGRNSGVIHSGVYYAPGSLKAHLCREGRELLLAYADARGIAYELCGKLIVAREVEEFGRLEELKRRAMTNGVAGLRDLTAREIEGLEPYVAGARALHVPGTGIIDFSAVSRAYADDVRHAGGEIHLARVVTSIRTHHGRIELETPHGAVVATRAIACAGLQSDRLLRLAGARPSPVRIVPFRGDYYTLVERARGLVRGLIYPVPDPAFPFLGIHFTPMIDGSVTVGPNAVLSLAREGYRRTAFNLRDTLSTLTYGGFWRFAAHHLSSGVVEVVRDVSKRAFVAEMRRYVPAVNRRDVVFGPCGIRAQALKRDGTLVDDFVFAQSDRMMHVVNAPSPGATAAIAIARHIAQRIDS